MITDTIYQVAVQKMPDAIQLHGWAWFLNGLRENGNLIAGIGASVAAIASCIGIHNANRTRREERERSSPDLQFTAMSLHIADEGYAPSLVFTFKNTRQNKLHLVELVTFLLYPSTNKRNRHDYSYAYRQGSKKNNVRLGCSIIDKLELKTKIVVIIKATDIFGNIGINSYTIRYVDNGFSPSDQDYEPDFEMLPLSEVYRLELATEPHLIGTCQAISCIHNSVVPRMAELIKARGDSETDPILKKALDNPSDNHILKQLYPNRFANFLESLISDDLASIGVEQ